MLKGKHIVVGITGGIAAYKVPQLIRDFRKRGADIRVVMTESAQHFVTPLVVSTVSQSDVVVGMFPPRDARMVDTRTWHITLGAWADVMLVVPATANVIAKLAQGIADDAVTTLALALRCPLIVAPAMDRDMWDHPATQTNLVALKERGAFVIPPEAGELASGLVGPGRLARLSAIIRQTDLTLNKAHRDLRGKRIVVTAGPTYEPIDPVRFIGNRSSGKMGFALALAASHRGADVTLISGPVHLPTPPHVRRVNVETALQMNLAVGRHTRGADALLMAAAVADYAPAQVSPRKIKKSDAGDGTTLILKKTPDILKHVARHHRPPVVVGFALETDAALRNAKTKLKEKNLDLIILNKANQRDAGFGTDTNIVTIIPRTGRPVALPRMHKYDVAHEILHRVARLIER